MPELVGYLLLFTGVGVAFILVNLSVGKLIRPATMNPEKATIYECGEPTIGSAWVQFDLRFYVVALLFVIFDVEMAFFFPWAVVFGRANQLADPRLAPAERVALTKDFLVPPVNPADQSQARAVERLETLLTKDPATAAPEEIARGLAAPQRSGRIERDRETFRREATEALNNNVRTASGLGWLAFAYLLLF